MSETKKTKKPAASILRLPTIPMRGLVAFPSMVMHFDIARERSVAAIQAAMEQNRKIFLVTQKDVFVEEPKKGDVYRIGVIAEVRQTLKTPDNAMRVLVEGISKARLLRWDEQEACIYSEVRQMPAVRARVDELELKAVVRSVKECFERYSQLVPRMPADMVASVLCREDPYALFETITYNVNLDYTEKQLLLEESNILVRMSMLYGFLLKEVEILDLEKQIQTEVQENIDKGQREYYLREQMKVIASQLGEDEGAEECQRYLERIDALQLDEASTEKLVREAERLAKMPNFSQEGFVIRNYLDTCLDLPWNVKTKDKLNLQKAQQVLDQDHYGLEKVKSRILESIAVRAMTPEVTGQILCLVGPPGVGKTSIGRSIAKALGRNYVRVSLGGIRDEAEIRGHRKTYIGAMPGRIMNAVKQAGSSNPLILLDEIDKMSNDYKGDPSSAMLEVLDAEQNREFRDHFIELPFDLSHVLFVTTANTTETIPAPLLDRMEVIELSSYTRQEKFEIAKRHLLPKQLKKHGLRGSQLRVSDDGMFALIDYYTKEAGVRNLEREIASLCRKTAKELMSGAAKRVQITAESLEGFLGVRRYLPDLRSDQDEIGMVNGLAWTAAGGVLMPLEVLTFPGKGEIQLTGSLGDVMKESARLAVSCARTLAERYGYSPKFYQELDLHIHAPEGAVPKDGPSAGVTMVTALISALSGIPVRGDTAMTGEITLRGKVLPIGGLREKCMAAYKAGIRRVLLPKGNYADLTELDPVVRESLELICVSDISEVLAAALAGSCPDRCAAPLTSQSRQESYSAVHA